MNKTYKVIEDLDPKSLTGRIINSKNENGEEVIDSDTIIHDKDLIVEDIKTSEKLKMRISENKVTILKD